MENESDVFVLKRKDAKDTAFDVITTLGLQRRAAKGLVGMEIEVEASSKLPKPPGAEGTHTPTPLPNTKFWAYVHDGSLRGTDNAEYLLTKPIAFEDVEPAIAELWGVFNEKRVSFSESNRTSVHVHLNVQRFHLNRLTSFMAMYFILEEILTEWCGEHRVGNLFCLRAKDAPAIISQIRRFIRADMRAPLREHHHYAGLNSNAIHKYGSLEFRPLRGVSDPEIIKQWVGILQRLYELSAEYPDPRSLISSFSSIGPFEFFDRLLGEHGAAVRKTIAMSDEHLRESIYQGIRMAQDICYARDWTKFQSINLKPDPFGRSPKTVVSKIQQQADEQSNAVPAHQIYDEYEEPDWDPPEAMVLED